MRANKPFYITTTLPYVNADPHIGFAVEIIRADVIARYRKLSGREVFFNTGTDEHGQKIYLAAKAAGRDPQSFVDDLAEKFRALRGTLNLLPDLNFTRTTDPHHIRAARQFWNVCHKNGFIYKKNYQVKYCVGCELPKTESELENGRCPVHSNLKIELIEEENYFFKFSAFADKLLRLYESRPDFVVPAKRFGEIKVFVSRGLQDFSISRLKSKMPWGIEVPGDGEQVMYVWFDALVNYISAVGWPDDPEKFNKWQVESGGMVQYCGKDNLRQQSAMWQAMLMAAGLPPSRQIVIDGFITGEGGAKMSKSLGNVVSPFEIVAEYGADALRYFVCRELHPFEDSPFTMERFRQAYNANLANGLGNLTSRLMRMAAQAGVKIDLPEKAGDRKPPPAWRDLETFEINKTTDRIWEKITVCDKKIQEKKPFEKIKTAPAEARADIRSLLEDLGEIAFELSPILPAAAGKIGEAITSAVPLAKPLFPKKE